MFDQGDSATRQPISYQTVVEVVSEFFSVNSERITRPDYTPLATFARDLSIFLCRDVTEASLVMVGQIFNQSHTTILLIEKRINDELQTSLWLETLVDQLIEEIRVRSQTTTTPPVQD